MEDLTYIREDNSNEWVHKWAFRQLQDFLEYKTTLKGIRVVYVNPYNTSKKCSQYSNLNTTDIVVSSSVTSVDIC